MQPNEPSEKRLWKSLLNWVKRKLAVDQVAVMDAGVKLPEVQEAGISRYVLRLPTNFTARRNQPADYTGKGPQPIYGAIVRPLERRRKDKTIAATSPVQPTGFWDRKPRRIPGRFRRLLIGKPFSQSYPFPDQLRKKASVIGHLLKGIHALKRKSATSTPVSTP